MKYCYKVVSVIQFANSWRAYTGSWVPILPNATKWKWCKTICQVWNKPFDFTKLCLARKKMLANSICRKICHLPFNFTNKLTLNSSLEYYAKICEPVCKFIHCLPNTMRHKKHLISFVQRNVDEINPKFNWKMKESIFVSYFSVKY